MQRLAVIACMLGGCGNDGAIAADAGSDGADGAVDGRTGDARTSFAIATTPGRLNLRAGSTATLTIHVTGTIAGPTKLLATGLPAGVTIESRTIAVAGDVALTVSASATAVPSIPAPSTIIATLESDPAQQAQAMVDIRVLGASGTLDTTYDADGRLDVIMPDSISKELAFEDDYDFYTVEASYFVKRRRAVDGALDPTWVQDGLLNVLGTRLLVVDANRIAIQRSYFGSGTIVGDISLHDATGHRVWRKERPYSMTDPKRANGAIYIQSGNAGTAARIESVSLAGVITPIVSGDGLNFTGYTDLAVDANGRIAIGGERSPRVAIGRYTSAGQADAAFGTAGAFELANPLASPAGGSAYLALAPTGGGAGFALVYFHSLSSVVGGQSWLVPFSASGVAGTPVAVTSASPTSFASQIAIQLDGKILVAGSDAGAGFVRRYHPSGQLDPAFASGGSLALSRVPDRMFLFADDERIVLSTVEQIVNGGTIHLTRVWL